MLALSLHSLPGATQARGAAAGRDAAEPGAVLCGWDAGARQGECRGGAGGQQGKEPGPCGQEAAAIPSRSSSCAKPHLKPSGGRLPWLDSSRRIG